MATINDTKKVWDSDSENEECKYMYKINTPKGNSFCLNMRNNGFWNSDNMRGAAGGGGAEGVGGGGGGGGRGEMWR